MGNICEDQEKILVEEYVQRCRGVHGKLREMSSLLRGLTPRRVASDILIDDQLQMDGRHCSHADRDWTKEVLDISSGRSHEPSGRSSALEENVVALLRACVEKGGTTGVLDLEEMETRR